MVPATHDDGTVSPIPERSVMPKKDITQMFNAVESLLGRTANPLHRQILENYRRHVILETCGQGERIFDPDMTVEKPVYYIYMDGYPGLKMEGDEVREFYKTLPTSGDLPVIIEDEQIMVSDWGFTSKAYLNMYQRGHRLIEKGMTVNGEQPDPDGYYIVRNAMVGMWLYDEQGRLIGEQE
jgi:hypothetical protein